LDLSHKSVKIMISRSKLFLSLSEKNLAYLEGNIPFKCQPNNL
jgi:hypothetical protein